MIRREPQYTREGNSETKLTIGWSIHYVFCQIAIQSTHEEVDISHN